jgi:hypothetical protein
MSRWNSIDFVEPALTAFDMTHRTPLSITKNYTVYKGVWQVKYLSHGQVHSLTIIRTSETDIHINQVWLRKASGRIANGGLRCIVGSSSQDSTATFYLLTVTGDSTRT